MVSLIVTTVNAASSASLSGVRNPAGERRRVPAAVPRYAAHSANSTLSSGSAGG
jgi:hypothetical protein